MMHAVPTIAKKLGAAVQQLRKETGWTQEALAAEIRPPEDDSRVQTWMSNRERGIVEFLPSQIARAEEVMKIPLGTVYARLGLIEPSAETEAAIKRDPLLSEEGRATILGAYKAAVASHYGA